MKISNMTRIGIVLLAAVFVSFEAAAAPRGRVVLNARKKNIVLSGGEHTLESIAAAVRNPQVFRYDPASRRAVCRARLEVRGRLVLANEILELEMPGREGLIAVAPKGALILKNATLKAAGNGKYDLVSHGVIRAENSTITEYDANSSRSFRLEKNSSTVLKNCRLRGRYIYLVSPDVEFVVEKCDFSGSPLSVRLRENITAMLKDCSNVSNPGLAAGACLLICRSVTVKLTDGEGKPLSGAVVTASARSRTGRKFLFAPVETNREGAAVTTAAVLDFDAGGGNSFYRVALSARIGKKEYMLKKDWRPVGETLEFRLKGGEFVAPGGCGERSAAEKAASAAAAVPPGFVPAKGLHTVGNGHLHLAVNRENGMVTEISGRYWHASGKGGFSLFDENDLDVSGVVAGVKETPRGLTLCRSAGEIVTEESVFAEKDHLTCRMKITNLSGRRLYRTVVFSVPIPGTQQFLYWNGIKEEKFLPGRKYGDSVMTGRFPMSCVYSEKSGIALGIDGSQFFSYLGSGGIPGESFYYAVKLVIDPGKTEGAVFILYDFKPDFRHWDALQIYYDMFPEFFSPHPGVSPLIYGIGGKVRAPSDPTYRETCRRFHIGWDWIYAPFQRTGFWYPEKKEWNSRAGRDSSFPPRKGVRYYGLEQYREAIRMRQKSARNACVAAHYIIPRSCDTELADLYFPDAILKTVTGSRISAAGVFADRRGVCMYTFGNSYGKRTLGDIEKIVKDYDVGGFAFDEAWGNEFCFGGKGVEHSPGRTFMEDALCALTAVPYAKCMDKVHSMKNTAGYTPAVVSNMPQVYMAAFRSDAVLFENPWYRGTRVLKQIRNLVGRKPISMWEGYPLDFKPGTAPEILRKKLRETVRDLILFSMATGVTPGIMHTSGFPEAFKAVPAILELARAGWEPVPAIHAPKGLEIGRFGKGTDTRIALVNRSDKDFAGTLVLDNRYLSGGTHFFHSIFDSAGIGVLEKSKLLGCRLTPGRTELAVGIPAHAALLLRSAGAIGLSSGYADVSVREDGPDVLRIILTGNAGIEGDAVLAFDADLRRFDRVEINGRRVQAEEEVRAIVLKNPAWKDRQEIVLYGHPRILTENIARISTFAFVGEDKPLCEIVVPDSASAEELEAAQRLVGYFAFYFRQIRRKRVILPIRRGSEVSRADRQVVIDGSLREKGYDGSIRSDGKRILIGGNVKKAMTEFLSILDRRYPYCGECTDPAFQYIRKHGLTASSVFE